MTLKTRREDVEMDLIKTLSCLFSLLDSERFIMFDPQLLAQPLS